MTTNDLFQNFTACRRQARWRTHTSKRLRLSAILVSTMELVQPHSSTLVQSSMPESEACSLFRIPSAGHAAYTVHPGQSSSSHLFWFPAPEPTHDKTASKTKAMIRTFHDALGRS